MNKKEQLEKAVVDADAAWDDAAWDAADAWDYTADAEDAAWDAWVKAKQELEDYLKEQDNE